MTTNVAEQPEVRLDTTMPLSSIRELQRLPEQLITHAPPATKQLAGIQLHSPIQEVRVAMAEMKVENRPIKLVTSVGSCVALCLYDPINRCGGLAHIMLPAALLKSHNSVPCKFADTAVPALAAAVREISGKDTLLSAKIAGGANILSNLSNTDQTIGMRNVAAVKAALSDNKINLVGEDVGGSYGRRIEFSIRTGIVTIRRSNGVIKEL
ncbi:MAG: chemotaxis protein CheD [Candidatus Bathyarchaeales archaeon]